MQVIQTAGAPPSSGSTIRANMGWIENTNTAEMNSALPNRSGRATAGARS